jgi:N-acetyl-alpha-D-muramate 1-phosphate uridylyltransferase
VKDSLAPVCILAGGLGTRLGERVRDTPKPLIEVAGQPFLAHQLALLRSYGARRVVLCVGYLGERIEARLGDGGAFGLELRYRYDPPGLAGTAGAVRAALEDLGGRFLVLYGDTYLRIDYRDVEARAAGHVALMAVLENGGRWDTSNVVFARGRVVRYDKRAPTPDMHWIDYGLSVLTPEALAGEEDDLSDAFHRLAAEGRLAGYEATERFYEIGTTQGLAETDAFLSSVEEPRPQDHEAHGRDRGGDAEEDEQRRQAEH